MVVLGPMASDIHTSRYPDTIMGFYVIEESLQGPKAPRPANQPTVETNGQHFWRVLTLGLKHVEGIP